MIYNTNKLGRERDNLSHAAGRSLSLELQVAAPVHIHIHNQHLKLFFGVFVPRGLAPVDPADPWSPFPDLPGRDCAHNRRYCISHCILYSQQNALSRIHLPSSSLLLISPTASVRSKLAAPGSGEKAHAVFSYYLRPDIPPAHGNCDVTARLGSTRCTMMQQDSTII